MSTSRPSRSRTPGVIIAIVGSLLAGVAHAEMSGANAEDFDHRVVIGAGGAFEVEQPSGSVHGGGNIFIEREAVEGWLELELGISALAADGGVVVPIDLSFKKPFRLARRIEIMVGLGPEFVIYRNTSKDGSV